MASIVNRPEGHKWIQFKGLAGTRQTLRLGKTNLRRATEFKLRVEFLLSAKAMGHPLDIDTSRWVASLSPDMRGRLAAAGLLQGQVAPLAHTVDDMVTRFRESLNVQPSTSRLIAIACQNLVDFCGADKPIALVTDADAKAFRAWLGLRGGVKGGKLAEATVSRRTRRVKEAFTFAVNSRWLSDNPFANIKGWNEVNRSKDFHVSMELIQQIVDQVPEFEFAALIVLARFGGLRCPSEVVPLRWEQINWEHETIRVESPKTKRYSQGQNRVVPMFPEIKAFFSRLWEEAEEGAVLVFPSHQVTGARLTNKLRKVAWSAGHALWPRPWQNMRASRETELLSTQPIHVVANWFGHSPAVAIQHYAQIVKEHSAKAVNVKLGKSVLRHPLLEKKAKQNPKHSVVIRGPH